jgi:hypothetical protein
MTYGPLAAAAVRRLEVAPAGDMPTTKQLAVIPIVVIVAATWRPVLNAEFLAMFM